MTARIQDIDFSVNALRALLWEYNEAETLTSLVEQKNDWYAINQTQFWTDWLRDVFDLRTANDFGCTVWSIILGIPLQIITPPITKKNFGFGTFNTNFNHATFGTTSQSVIDLTTEQKRVMLQLRYFKLISRCNVIEINRVLKAILAPYGLAYVLGTLDMSSIKYVFKFRPSSQLMFIFQNADVLPRPSTLGLDMIISPRPVWGFGTFRKNFNNGTFSF